MDQGVFPSSPILINPDPTCTSQICASPPPPTSPYPLQHFLSLRVEPGSVMPYLPTYHTYLLHTGLLKASLHPQFVGCDAIEVQIVFVF